MKLKPSATFGIAFVAASAMLVTWSGGDSGASAKSDFVGVAPASSSCSAKVGGSITIALAEDLPTLDPAQNGPMGATAVELYPLIFDRFFRPTANLSGIEPQLATSATATSNYTVWTIQLRHGVKFQNGAPFTSADAVFSLNYSLKGDNGYALGPVKTITAVGPYAVKVTMSSPYAQFEVEGLSSQVGGWVYPNNLDGESEAKFFADPVGTGPYSVESYNSTSGVQLTANTNYWNTPGPYIKNIDARFVPDASQRILGLESGEFAYADDLTSTQMNNLPKGIVGRVLPSTAVDTMFIFPKSKFLRDSDVRHAMNLALDRSKIVSIAYGSAFASPAKSLAASSLPGMPRKASDPYVLNLTKAKSLMAHSKFPKGGSFTMVYVIGDSNIEAEAEVIQSELSQIGIHVSLSPVGSSEYGDLQQTRGYAVALFNNTALTPSPIDLLGALLLNSGNGLVGVWPYATLTHLNNLLNTTTNPTQVTKLYGEVESYMGKLLSSIAVSAPDTLSAQSSTLNGLTIGALNEPRINGAWLCGK